jgi:VanZ family protein
VYQINKNKWAVFSISLKIIWVLSIAFVAYLSLSPTIEFPFKFKGIDKVYHSLAYLWLATIPFFGFRHLKMAFAGAFLMIPFGIALEYAQRFVMGRLFSTGDMAANAIGVILGIALGMLLKSRLFVNFQS